MPVIVKPLRNSTTLLGEYGTNGTKEYVYLGSTPIAMVQGANVLTIQTDHLNTPRLVTNSTKALQWRWGYSAFVDTAPVSINATTLNLRYPGQYYDAESMLHYNINRYYDSVTGRYTQSDLIGLKGGINTYGYVGGNPIGYVDPTGLDVYLCSQPAFGWSQNPIDHHWIKTALLHNAACVDKPPSPVLFRRA
jgi:RHS repeat-associated protein